MAISKTHVNELKIQAAKVRKETVQLIFDGKGGHIGGDLSEVDLLVTIYDYMQHDPQNPESKDRDYFILSTGHAAEAYYTVLAEHGYISRKELDSFGKFGGALGGHPSKKTKGVEANTGSLGHGLGLATGMALALQRDERSNRVCVLTGDGELAEGSVWEAAMSAAKFKLSNLTWLIDRNHLQISGNTEDVMPLEELKGKTEAFGFETRVIDGHDIVQIHEALAASQQSKPVCIIANTTKGKGLACAENQASWHHKTPTLEQVEQMEHAYEEVRKELA
ncbi:MAG: transketolase [Lachnospiraceae bacterium]